MPLALAGIAGAAHVWAMHAEFRPRLIPGRARWLGAALCLAVLVGCAERRLSTGERAFTASVMGDAVEVADVRVVKGAVVGLLTATVPPRPRTTCREKIWPPRTETITGRFGAMVVDEGIYYTTPNWQVDFLAGYPDGMNLPEAMRFAHEMTHVWQWQRRDMTGYHPLKASREHVRSDDPYLIDPDPTRPFLSYAYEQQAVLVEEFVCCRALDPQGARTQRLFEVMRQVFPGAARVDPVAEGGVFVPWKDVVSGGICA